MKAMRTFALSLLLALAIGGCGSMSTRDQYTVGGAAIGAVGGAALTHGAPLATVGGGVVGAVIGNQVGKHRD